MFYDSPTQTDYVNIHALNREFLKLMRSCPDRFELDSLLASRLTALGRAQLERLASTPFLLFSISEQDEVAWQEICRDDPNNDLFENRSSSDAEIGNLLATTIGFLWQLAQQNPYSVRMICGGSPAWCELISAMTYFELVSFARNRGDLLTLRQAPNADIWSKLLLDGVRAERQIRSAAHIAALQTLLTCQSNVTPASWPRAARRATPRYLHVADEPGKT